MKDILKLGAILFLITAVAAGLLAVANAQTTSKIEELAAAASDEARSEVFTDADKFVESKDKEAVDAMKKNENILEVYEAQDSSNKNLGYVIKTLTTEGYGGTIEIITGISSEGEITGIKVGQNQETPGLGTNAAEPEFQDQYEGKTAEMDLEVVKNDPAENQIQALTGATITSSAVTNAVNTALDTFESINQ